MKKIRLGIVAEEPEYSRRLVSCLMNHYRDQMVFYVYTGVDQWIAHNEQMDCVLLSDLEEETTIFSLLSQRKIPAIYLYDEERRGDAIFAERFAEGQETQIKFADKYLEIPRLADLIRKSAETGLAFEPSIMIKNGIHDSRIIGVYSLSDTSLQLPFFLTYASMCAETERVLALDLQENSGALELYGQIDGNGMEELFLLLQRGEYTRSELLSCIGHLEGFDYLCCVENSECLCEVDAQSYLKMLQVLKTESQYSVILINFGTRFQGFFQMMEACSPIYLIHGTSPPATWREAEFRKEGEKRGMERILQCSKTVEVSVRNAGNETYERMMEEWKWSGLGDLIRKETAGSEAEMGG